MTNMQIKTIQIIGERVMLCGDFILVCSGIQVYMFVICELMKFVRLNTHDLPMISVPLRLRSLLHVAYITAMIYDLRNHDTLPSYIASELFFTRLMIKMNSTTDITPHNVCDYL